MGTYVARRLLQAIPLLLVISLALFGLLHLIPGGPEQVAFSPRMSAQARHDMVVALGLDQPLPIQYVKWLWGTIHLDFGNTYKDGQPVLSTIGDRLPATLELLGISFVVALLLAIPLGIIAAVKQYSIIDYFFTLLSYLGISMPVFWFAEMLILFLAIQHNWFPTGDMQTEGQPSSFIDSVHHLVLPVIVLSFAFIAAWSRYLRSSMLEVLHQDYLRTARAKGLRRIYIVLKHAFRNALIPLVTVVALDLSTIFGGAVITETIFSWPGLGRLFFDSLESRDYPVLMAMMVLSAFAVVVCNIIADIIYGLLDPGSAIHEYTDMNPLDQIAAPGGQNAPPPTLLDTDLDVRHHTLAGLTWQRFRKHKLALVASVALLLLATSAIFAPWLAPYNPDHMDFAGFNGAPSHAHPFGSDFSGRDVLSRVLYGGRISLLIGFTSMITAITIGTVLGALAGYFGGWVDNVIMRLTDVVLSFPLYLLLFVLSAFIAGVQGAQNVLMIVLIIMAVSWTYIARLVRGEFLSLKEREFIQAAHAMGVSPAGIIVRHLLPNSIAPIVVNATLLVGNNIILESVLSFFGFGVQPPTSSWGSMLADGITSQSQAPWETIYPGLMILITVLSVNLLGDGLRDALDPFSRRGR